jgi:hypothetical protein
MRRLMIRGTRALLVGMVLAPAWLAAQSAAPARADTAGKKKKADTTAKKVEPPPPPPPVTHLETSIAGIKLTGFAEASYAYSSRSSGDTIIVGRLYDRFQNQFMLNGLAVVLDKPYDPTKLSAGFHTELLIGQNANLIRSPGLYLGNQADLPHLYVTLNVPTASGNGLQFKVGRIPTLMGLEVIETPANPNWSEGNQFIYVENFTGTGLSIETKFNNYVDAQFRVINGWDLVQDNNQHKSLMGRVGLYPDTLSSIGITAFVGPEEPGDNLHKRSGVEALLWRKLGNAQVWVQGDWGKEQANAALPTPTQDATWSAYGVWVTYDFSATVGLALRGDYVNDKNGARSSGAFGYSVLPPTNTGRKFGSGTATLNLKAWPNAIVRPELRYDSSSLLDFAGHANQITMAVGVAYVY